MAVDQFAPHTIDSITHPIGVGHFIHLFKDKRYRPPFALMVVRRFWISHATLCQRAVSTLQEPAFKESFSGFPPGLIQGCESSALDPPGTGG